MKATKYISRSTAALVIFLAISAAVLSYDALRLLAEDNGVKAGLAFLWPLVIDGFIIIASLSVLRNSLLAERTIYAWTLVVIFSLASVIFNIAHAPNNLTAQAIAAVPPLALLLSFELLMSQLKSEVRRTQAINSLAELTAQAQNERAKLADLTAKNETLLAKVDALQAEIKQLYAIRKDAKKAANSLSATENDATLQDARDARQQQISARRAQVAQHLADGKSNNEIAKLLDVSSDTIRRDKQALENPDIVDRIFDGVIDEDGKDAMRRSAEWWKNEFETDDNGKGGNDA